MFVVCFCSVVVLSWKKVESHGSQLVARWCGIKVTRSFRREVSVFLFLGIETVLSFNDNYNGFKKSYETTPKPFFLFWGYCTAEPLFSWLFFFSFYSSCRCRPYGALLFCFSVPCYGMMRSRRALKLLTLETFMFRKNQQRACRNIH